MPARLAAMMFLLYFALGAWSLSFPSYQLARPGVGLAFTSGQVAWVASAFALAGMAATPLVGLLADRLFRADRLLAVTSLVAAGFLAAAAAWCDHRAAVTATAADPAGAAAGTFGPLFALMLGVHFHLQLALTLGTVVALRNLPDPGGFSRSRMWGTVGWVVAGNAVALVLVGVSTQPVYLGAAAFAALGVYALTLPATPPAGRGTAGRTLGEAFGLPAVALFGNRSFAVYVAVTVVVVAMNQFYGVYAHRFLTDRGLTPAERYLTLGQAAEVGILFVVPWLHPTRRLKALLLVGLGGWVVRALALRYGSDAVILTLGVPMHGWAFAFFQVVGAVYLDREAPAHLRASVQAVLAFVTGGLGNFAGNLFAGAVVAAHTADAVVDWPAVWVTPLVGCSAAFALFALLFRPPAERSP